MSHHSITPPALNWKRALPILCLAAACVAAPLQAAPGNAGGKQRVTVEHGRGEPYVLVRNGHNSGVNHIGHAGADTAAIKELKRSIDGDFLWFRNGGKAYVVQDGALLGKVAAAWEPLERLGKEMEVYGERMGRQGAKMGSLGGDMALAAVTLRGARMEEIGKKMEEAGKPMEALGKKMDVLGKKMEKESDNADKVVRALIQESLASGRARPVQQNG